MQFSSASMYVCIITVVVIAVMDCWQTCSGSFPVDVNVQITIPLSTLTSCIHSAIVQGRFSLAAKYYMNIGDICESELVDLERVCELLLLTGIIIIIMYAQCSTEILLYIV